MINKLDDLVTTFLEGDIYTLEELLEIFDVSPFVAIETLFDSGLIDEEIVDELLARRE
jgi:hypothetical protein